MKKAISISLLLILSAFSVSTSFAQTESENVQQVTSVPQPVQSGFEQKMEQRIDLLEVQLLQERNANRLTDRLDLFINALGVFATIMFTTIAAIGTFLVLNVNRTRDNAESLLRQIEGMAVESKKIKMKLKKDSDNAVEQAEKTIKTLTDNLVKSDKMTQQTEISIKQWERSRRDYAGTANVSVSPSALNVTASHIHPNVVKSSISPSIVNLDGFKPAKFISGVLSVDESEIPEDK